MKKDCSTPTAEAVEAEEIAAAERRLSQPEKIAMLHQVLGIVDDDGQPLKEDET